MIKPKQNPINVIKGWKENALSQKAKSEVLQNVITSLKNLPQKNKLKANDLKNLLKSKVDISDETTNHSESEGCQILSEIFTDIWKHNENQNFHSYDYTKEANQLAHMMKSYSEKLYELIYKAFYLPNPLSVEAYFSKKLKEKKRTN